MNTQEVIALGNDFYFEEQPPRKGGKGWFYTSIILIAFIVGGLFVQYVLPSFTGGDDLAARNLKATRTVAPAGTPEIPATAAPTAEPAGQPSVAPEIGGKISLLESGNIPEIVKAVGPAVVGVSNKVSVMDSEDREQGYGSGVIISADGYIVTNYHVIAGANSVTVILSGGKEVDARIVGSDEYTDLAVLKIDETGLTVMPFGDSDIVAVGDLAIAIGNPLGYEFAGTVTAGIISGKDRQITVDGRTITMLQTDAAINPGNSGGALLNSDGELIGINSLKSLYTSTGISVEGLGFAIPINSARPIIEELIAEGHIKRPVLGVRGREITAEISEYYNIPQGFIIREIIAGGPAEKAGLRIGDIIVALDGEQIETLDRMSAIIFSHDPGDQITLSVWREGKELNIPLTLGES